MRWAICKVLVMVGNLREIDKLKFLFVAAHAHAAFWSEVGLAPFLTETLVSNDDKGILKRRYEQMKNDST